MALKKIAIQGGVVKDDTVYSSEGKWIDSDKIRFYNGRAQKIGGWEKLTPSAFNGAARTIHSWRDFNDNRLVAIGTHSNIYILKDGILYDITPDDPTFTPLTISIANLTTFTDPNTGSSYYFNFNLNVANDNVPVNITDQAYAFIPPSSNIPATAYSYNALIGTGTVRNTYGNNTDGVIRFRKPSHGLQSGDSGLNITNVALGDYRVSSFSGTVVDTSSYTHNGYNYQHFDVALPSGFSSGTSLQPQALNASRNSSISVGDHMYSNSGTGMQTYDRYIGSFLYAQNRHNDTWRFGINSVNHYFPGWSQFNASTDLVADVSNGGNSIGDKVIRIPASQNIGFSKHAIKKDQYGYQMQPNYSDGGYDKLTTPTGGNANNLYNVPNAVGTYYGEQYNWGSRTGWEQTSLPSGISQTAHERHMFGHPVTDALGRPTARRVVVKNVPFPVPPPETDMGNLENGSGGTPMSLTQHASSYAQGSGDQLSGWDGHFRSAQSNPTGGNPPGHSTSDRLLYGIVSQFNPYFDGTNGPYNGDQDLWYYGRMKITIIGQDYNHQQKTEFIYPTGVEQQGIGPFTNETYTYSQNFFTQIWEIKYEREDTQTGNHPRNQISDKWTWSIVGTVSLGWSEECLGIHYDHPIDAVFPWTNFLPASKYDVWPSTYHSQVPQIEKLMEQGEEHSNFAYGWGTNVWQANGWLGGSGSYSRAWGQPASTSSVVVDPRVYSFDNFGEDLVIAHNNGTPMYWDASTGVGSKAVKIDNTASPTTPQSGGTGTSPATVKSIFVSSPDRHIVCLGAGNPMTVQWASQETTNVWTINDPNNTAGSQVLTGGTYLIGWAKVRGQTLIFSDNNVTGMVFQGPPYTFGFKELGNNCGLISPQGAITVQGRCYWMGFKNFFIFDGGVKVLPSPVAKYVFEDFNYAEQFKVISGTSKGYNEIWWFYPSLSTNDETTSTNAAGQNREINRYVKYNYIENLWDVGTFSRTAWVGGSIFENDLACDANRFIYKHDVGTTDDGSPFNAFVESADFDIDDGQNIMLVDKALPDAISTDKQGGTYDETYKITFSSRKDSIGDYTNKGPFTVRNRDVTIDGVNYIKTGRINPRVRGRQMKIKVESDGLHDHWRLGDLRLDMKPDGER